LMSKPRLGVFKFSSCDGCQLSILDAEDELLELLGRVELADFLEASSASAGAPYDVALVEGSISTEEEVERIIRIRKESKMLVALGACATSGGLQALRNWSRLGLFESAVYPEPKVARALEKALPVSDFVAVDFELRGCPVSKAQLLQFFAATLRGTKPRFPASAVCFECKREGNPCLVVAGGTPCLGPVTASGCGALCPSRGRGCYGCFGPSDDANLDSYASWLSAHRVDRSTIGLLLKGANSQSPEFRRWIEKNG
jgi:coenzyme F420-reducing hydrogenase gamma subunit